MLLSWKWYYLVTICRGLNLSAHYQLPCMVHSPSNCLSCSVDEELPAEDARLWAIISSTAQKDSWISCCSINWLVMWRAPLSLYVNSKKDLAPVGPLAMEQTWMRLDYDRTTAGALITAPLKSASWTQNFFFQFFSERQSYIWIIFRRHLLTGALFVCLLELTFCCWKCTVYEA